MRIMLDTNILLSAMLFPSKRMDTLIYKASVENQLVLSTYILDEIFNVVRRKFITKESDVDKFLQHIPYELVYTPKHPDLGLFIIRDPDDYAVLYSAIVENIDVFITGDKDFNEVTLECPKIMTPSQFLAL